MTRKDYVAIAKVFSHNAPTMMIHGDGDALKGAQNQWHLLRHEIAKVFSSDNQIIDCGRFFEACTKE